MRYTENDMDGILTAFGDTCYIDGDEYIGLYFVDWIQDLDTTIERHFLHTASYDLEASAITYGATVSVPSENFTGTVRNVTTDGAGFVVLELRKS
jgi:hypothetical protein